MPAVAKTSEADIVAAARRLLGRHGAEGLSMQAVAAAVGVQAPSLYKRFTDRAAILKAIARTVVLDLAQMQKKVAVSGSPHDDLRAIALGHRTYALKRPHLYGLIFGGLGHRQGESELSPEEYRTAITVLLDRVRALGGPEHALENARLLVAYVHGFVSMERAGAFRLGGDVEEAYAYGIEELLGAIRRRSRR